MIIREGTESDIPQIIQLLKDSLGESLIPKSTELWNWKHRANPFGESPTLVATTDNRIVGVRTFLRWEFTDGTRLIKACRAVDTAIHPEYQGEGLFKKLTLELVESLKAEEIDLIFNTPNSASLPGYLKMGWAKWGKLPLKLDFHFNSEKNKHSTKQQSWDEIENLISAIESEKSSSGQLNTNLTTGYLSWRYRDCPLFPYYFISDNKSYILFYRIKEGKMGRELRIADFFTVGKPSEKAKIELQKKLNLTKKVAGARFTSYSGLKFSGEKALDLGILPVVPMGPVVTLRQTNDKFSPLDQHWSWSLGDLEVF
jgi:N-acetylglutamate synthase-like GNAT family acetyltransferase